ncbi:MAG: hypothetical protein M0Q49_05625 [Porticoccaceae bacterium]|nr:hypothetical protein [Porticoccaceae bacterium]
MTDTTTRATRPTLINIVAPEPRPTPRDGHGAPLILNLAARAALGEVKVQATALDHVHVTGTVRSHGVLYSISAHLWRWADGAWRLGAEPGPDYTGPRREQQIVKERHHALTGNRAPWAGPGDGLTPSARVKIGEAVEQAITAWAYTPEASAALRVAQRADWAFTASRIEYRLSRAAEEWNAALADLDRIESNMRAFDAESED